MTKWNESAYLGQLSAPVWWALVLPSACACAEIEDAVIIPRESELTEPPRSVIISGFNRPKYSSKKAEILNSRNHDNARLIPSNRPAQGSLHSHRRERVSTDSSSVACELMHCDCWSIFLHNKFCTKRLCKTRMYLEKTENCLLFSGKVKKHV